MPLEAPVMRTVPPRAGTVGVSVGRCDGACTSGRDGSAGSDGWVGGDSSRADGGVAGGDIGVGAGISAAAAR